MNLRFRMEPQRAAASPREGPLLASAVASACAFLRKLRPELRFVSESAWSQADSIPQGIGGPQPPPGGGPQLLAVERDLRRLRPELGVLYLSVSGRALLILNLEF